MKRALFFAFCLVLISGCSVSDSAGNNDQGYWKVTLTADVSVHNDGSIPETGGGPIACFADGYIGSVLYFPLAGGKAVAQKSFVTIEKVTCINCLSSIVSPASDIPLQLAAVLEVQSVRKGSADGKVTAVFDDLRVWIDKPVQYPIDIYYDCGPIPGKASDYGSAVSQITSPFMTQVWSFSPAFGEIHSASFKDYRFPPTYSSDLEFKILEEHVKEIEITDKISQ